MSKNVIIGAAATFNAANLTANFQAVNPLGYPTGVLILRITNASNNVLNISYKGIAIDDMMLPNSAMELNFQSNSQPNNKVAQLAKNTVVYVSSATANAGTICVSWYYNPL